jgi:hypothetical protein
MSDTDALAQLTLMSKLLENAIQSETLCANFNDELLARISCIVRFFFLGNPIGDFAILYEGLFMIGLDSMNIVGWDKECDQDIIKLESRFRENGLKFDDIVKVLLALDSLAKRFNTFGACPGVYEKRLALKSTLYILETYVERGVIKIDTSALQGDVRKYHRDIMRNTATE